jgi:regulator of replication initiation timing
MSKDDIKKYQDEITFLKKEVERLKDELVRMVSRNLDLSERLEWDVELRRRTQVAREIMEGHVERQRNADLQDAIGMSPVEYRLMITRDF